jgi:hypothetical protein
MVGGHGVIMDVRSHSSYGDNSFAWPKKAKHKHWRAFPGTFGLEGSPKGDLRCWMPQ